MSIFKRGLFYLLVLCSCLSVVVTLVSLISSTSYWFIKIFDFPRLETLIVLLVLLIIWIFIKKKGKVARGLLMAGIMISILIQAYILFPYTPLGPKAIKNAGKNKTGRFSILVANVFIGNHQEEALLKIIHRQKPTILLTMEVNKRWVSHLNVLKSSYPYSIVYPTQNSYGMALYSSLPLSDSKVLFFNHDSVPSFNFKISLSDTLQFQMLTVHPVAPKPSKYPDNMNQKEIGLIKAARLVANRSLPTIVAGDFNDVGWSHNTKRFSKISGLQDVRYGRGVYNTFDATSFIMRWPLDYVFVSKEFKVVDVEVLPYFGSDHFPYYVELSLP